MSKLYYFKYDLLKEFEKACHYKTMKGSYPPEDWEVVDEIYDRARTRLINYVSRLLENQECTTSINNG